MWFCGMEDLDSTMKGIETNPDSGIKLKPSLGLGSESELVHEFGLNHRIQVHIHFPTIECDYPK